MKISPKTTSPFENDTFPDGLLGSRRFAFNSYRWWRRHVFSLETSACSQGPVDNSSKQSKHREVETAVMGPGHLAVGLEQRLSGSLVSQCCLGASMLLDSSAFACGVGRNFSGHPNWFRGFQSGSASEAPRELLKNTDLWAPPSPTESVFFKKLPKWLRWSEPGLETKSNPTLLFFRWSQQLAQAQKAIYSTDISFAITLIQTQQFTSKEPSP